MIKAGQFYFFFLVDDSATEIWFKNSVFILKKVHCQSNLHPDFYKVPPEFFFIG